MTKLNIKKSSSNVIITRPAALVRQGNLNIYTTSLKVRDLLIPEFYQIETLDHNLGHGFQRVLDERRAKRLKDYLLEGFKLKEAFLPTSIFLATENNIGFNSENNTITFNVSEIGPFNVVDGQHRIAGLVEAAKENPEIGDFEIPANIAFNLDSVSQMAHFLIVNTTQKSVNKDVQQQIVARLSSMIGVESYPTLPKWINREVCKGDDAKALSFVNYLIKDKDSPWFNNINMANDQLRDGSISQSSFVGSIKRFVISSNNPMGNPMWQTDKQNKILANYWRAIANLLIDPDSEYETVLLKTTGVDLFHIVSGNVFSSLSSIGDYRVSAIEDVLKGAFEFLPDELMGISTPEWWESGNEASGLNSSATRKISTSLNHAITTYMTSNKKIAV